MLKDELNNSNFQLKNLNIENKNNLNKITKLKEEIIEKNEELNIKNIDNSKKIEDLEQKLTNL